MDSKKPYKPETWFFIFILLFTLPQIHLIRFTSNHSALKFYICAWIVTLSWVPMGTNRCMQRLQQIFELMEINSIESKYLSNINFPKIFKPIHYKRPRVFFGLNREKPIWNNVILERKKHPTENTNVLFLLLFTCYMF